jgi:hypothetical protein
LNRSGRARRKEKSARAPVPGRAANGLDFLRRSIIVRAQSAQREEQMSATAHPKAPTPAEIIARKGGTPLVCLTAYTTPIAKLVDPHCDIVLVGDSLGMVLHGLPSTLGVTMEMMLMHGQAVARGLERAMMVIDMPFGSYEESPGRRSATLQG